MKLISSRTTYFNKKIFPSIWFGFLGVFAVVAIASGALLSNPVFLLVPITMAAFGFVVMKACVWDLVDEVYDLGDHLIVRNRGHDVVIPLRQIENITSVTIMNPPHVWLTFVKPNGARDKIAFMPPMGFFRFNPFARCAIVDDLKVRISETRS